MKKLITIITLLLLVTVHVAYCGDGVGKTPFLTSQAHLQGEGFPENSQFILKTPSGAGFSKVDVNVITGWKTKDGVSHPEPEYAKERHYPVFWGITDELLWYAQIDASSSFHLHGEYCKFLGEDQLNTSLTTSPPVEYAVCNAYGNGKSQEMPANTHRLLMFLRANEIGEHTEDYDWFPLDLYVKEPNLGEHLVCHLEFNFMFTWSGMGTVWWLNPPTYYNVDNRYNVEVQNPSLFDKFGGYHIVVKKLKDIEKDTKKFYMNDFFVMFRDIDNPFDKFEIRPRGQIGKNKFYFDDGKVVDLCNVYGTSKSDFLKSKYYTTTDELLSDFGKPGCNTEMDITIYN
ncbi:MAG: hypothetical protein ACP5OA_06600, partial [Candidatus Woesearchaeota archaeon]